MRQVCQIQCRSSFCEFCPTWIVSFCAKLAETFAVNCRQLKRFCYPVVSSTKMTTSIFRLLSVCIILNEVLQSYSFSTSTSNRYRSNALSMSIAPYKKPRAQNVPGNLFVDEGNLRNRMSYDKRWDEEGRHRHYLCCFGSFLSIVQCSTAIGIFFFV